MFNVVKKVGRKEELVKEFNTIEEAHEYIFEINDKNYVSAAKVGRSYGSVGISCPTTSSTRILNRQQKSYQKTLYNPANESKYFVQYTREAINKMNGVTPEVIPFPMITNVVDQTELLEVA